MMRESDGGPQLRERSKLIKESRDVKDHPKLNPSANKLFIILSGSSLFLFSLWGVLTLQKRLEYFMVTKGLGSNLNLFPKSFHPCGKDPTESI